MTLTKILYGMSAISLSLVLSVLIIKTFTVVMSIINGTFRFKNLLYVAVMIFILFASYFVGDKIY